MVQNYVDPSARARTARIPLTIYIVAQVIGTAAAWLVPNDGIVVGIISIASIILIIGALLATLAWIHRVSMNAHSFADGLTHTPGWAIGWYFIPIANLWKPFEAMKEIWQASEAPAEWPRVPVPALLRSWWGCWLGGNILAAVSSRFAGRVDPFLLLMTDLGASALLTVASVLLLRIIAEVSRMQPVAHAERAFA